MHPIMRIAFAPLTIACLSLLFPIKNIEPAETGIPKAMNIMFQPQIPQLGPKQKVRPIVTKINPNNRETPAPIRKLPSGSEFCSFSLVSITFTLIKDYDCIILSPTEILSICILFANSMSIV